MKFKSDENLPAEVVALLLSAGHDAHSVLDEDLGGLRIPLLPVFAGKRAAFC